MDAKTLQLMQDIFRGREDAFAIQQAPNSEGKCGYHLSRTALNLDIWKRHLEGLITIAIYPLTSDSKTHLFAFDIDQRDFKQVLAIKKTLINVGMASNQILTEFSGNKGYHVWLFFETSISSTLAWQFGELILNNSGIRCEKFPKQEKLSGNGYGNCIKAPLGIHKATQNRCWFVDDSFKPFPQERQVEILEAVRKVTQDQVEIALGRNKESEAKITITVEPTKFLHVLNKYPCYANIYHKGTNDGQRNDVGIRFASFLKLQEFSSTEIEFLLNQWNGRNTPPLGPEELKGLCAKTYHYKCGKDSILNQFCTPKLCSASLSKPIAQKNNDKNNHTYASFMTDKAGTIYEMCHDPNKNPPYFFARFRDGKVDYVHQVQLEDGKIIHPYLNDDMVAKGVVCLPRCAESYTSEKELLGDIQKFIHEYVSVSDFFEKICTYYAPFSWVYDRFEALPYLRAIGGPGTGKTRLLKVMAAICYKSTFTSGAATVSPIFRLLELFKGTLILNEGDFSQSDEYARITKIMNCGNEKGNPVLISETVDNQIQPKAYDVFGPKIIATRRTFSDRALESRCLTEDMDGKYSDKVPILLDSEFATRASKIRNQLLMWRFLHYNTAKVRVDLVDRTIEPRLNQIMLSLASMINDPEVLFEFKQFMRSYNSRLVQDRGMSDEAEVARAVIGLYDKTERMFMKEIAESVNEHRAKGEKPISAKKVGLVVRSALHLDIDSSSKGHYIPKTPKTLEKIGVLATMYSIPSSDIENKPIIPNGSCSIDINEVGKN